MIYLNDKKLLEVKNGKHNTHDNKIIVKHKLLNLKGSQKQNSGST